MGVRLNTQKNAHDSDWIEMAVRWRMLTAGQRQCVLILVRQLAGPGS